MKVIYTKAVLYAYTSIEAVKREIDDFVERRALASMNDYSPCDEQCEIIIEHMVQKVILTQLKSKIKAVLASLTKEELELLDYKYLKIRKKECFENIDTSKRSYYRKQLNLIKKVSRRCDKVLLTDEWFEKNCLKINAIKWMVKRVERKEEGEKRGKNKDCARETNKNENSNSRKNQRNKSLKLSA